MYRSNAGPASLKVENSCRAGLCPVNVFTPPWSPDIDTLSPRATEIIMISGKSSCNMVMIVFRMIEEIDS